MGEVEIDIETLQPEYARDLDALHLPNMAHIRSIWGQVLGFY